MAQNNFPLAYLGECHVQLELAKRDYKVLFTQPGFAFDLLGQDGKKIEVKAATPSKCKKIKRGRTYEYKVWQFRLSTEQQKEQPDFHVCVVLENLENTPLGYFIFPKGALKVYTEDKCGMLSIYESDISGTIKKENKLDRHQYLNKWDLITRI